MKRYTKDGITKPQNRIVLYTTEVIDGVEQEFQVINPSHDMLIEHNWVEYVEPQPTEEQLLNRAKRLRGYELKDYDSSREVNEFFIGDTVVWLDKSTRAGLMLRFQAEQAAQRDITTLWYEGQQFTLPLSQAIAMLYAVEVYASACYDNTQRHLANIDSLQSIEDVEAYDYTTGYPAKLEF